MSEDLYGHLRERANTGWDRIMCPPAGSPERPMEPGSFVDLTHKLLFGDVWQRPHLSVRERRLVTLTALAARGHDECTVAQVAAALRSGDLSPEDFEELIIQMAFYLGWPPAMQFWLILGRQVAAAREAEATPEPVS